jgi:hypothetical protein
MATNIRKIAGDLVRASWVGDRMPTPARRTSVVQAKVDPPSPYSNILGMPSQSAEMFMWVAEHTRAKRDRRADIELYEAMDDTFPEISCLAGDSRVFTLDRGWVTIEELAARTDPFWVLSYDAKRRSLVPAAVSSAHISAHEGHPKPMVRVTLDDGQAITCTADHLFLDKEGRWIQAGDLSPGQRLMPGHTRLRYLNGGDNDDNVTGNLGLYWQVHQPHTDSRIRSAEGKRWTKVHRLVAEELLGAGPDDQVHHLDHDSQNNDPSNLALVDPSTHAHHHIAKVDNSWVFKAMWTPERRQAQAELMRKKWAGNTMRRGTTASDEAKAKMSQAGKGRPKSPEHRRNLAEANRRRARHIPREEVEAALSEAGTFTGAARLLKTGYRQLRQHMDKYDLANPHANHRVVRVERIDDRPTVYDLTVPGYHNFVCNGVVVHNSALDVYADNSTQVGVTKADASRGADKVVQVVTDNGPLREFLGEVFQRLRLDSRSWPLARELCKYGEVFEEIVVTEKLKLDRLKQLPGHQMIRNEDEYGVIHPRRGFVQLDDSLEQVVATFEPWEVVHFRLLDRNERKYGRSILHPIRQVYKQLQLIEDAMVVARVTRAYSKLVFMVDTGTMPPALAHEHVEKIKNEHKKRRLLDPRTGRLKSDYNPIASEEDIFMGLSKGGQSRVDQLYGDLNIGNLSDVEYLQNKLYGGLKVPKAYLGIERDVNSRATVTAQDIQFARSVRRIQLALRFGFHQVADLALVLEAPKSLSREAANNRFSVTLPAMQTVDEMREWEVLRVQSEVARIWAQELYLDPAFVFTNLLGFSLEQASEVFKGTASPFAVDLGKNVNSQKSFTAGMDKKMGAATKEDLAADPRVRDMLHDLFDALATPDRDGVLVIEDLKWLLDTQLEQRRHAELAAR